MFAYCQGVDTFVVKGWEPLYEVHVHKKNYKIISHMQKKFTCTTNYCFLKKSSDGKDAIFVIVPL